MILDIDIEKAKMNSGLVDPHHEHNDCIRMAYEWLDAQNNTKNITRQGLSLKHIIEKWSGRYVSRSDVEVAASMHPRIKGKYPDYNISARLTLPTTIRLSTLTEAGKHNPVGGTYNPDTYKRSEST